MGEELILSRNRFIMRLLEQNFARVDGPGLKDGKRIFYDVWGGNLDVDEGVRVRIAFDRKFLSEPSNEFARTTLQALRKTKVRLYRSERTISSHGGAVEAGDEIRIGEDPS